MFPDDFQTDDIVIFEFETHTGHTAGGSAHGTDFFIGLVETASHTHAGGEQDLITVFAQAGTDKVVIFFDDQGAETDPAQILEESQFGLLDVAAAGSENDVFVGIFKVFL